MLGNAKVVEQYFVLAAGKKNRLVYYHRDRLVNGWWDSSPTAAVRFSSLDGPLNEAASIDDEALERLKRSGMKREHLHVRMFQTTETVVAGSRYVEEQNA